MDKNKTKKQLKIELKALRYKVATLEATKAKQKNTTAEIKRQKELLENSIKALTKHFCIIDCNDYTVQLINSAKTDQQDKNSLTCYNLIHNQDTPCNDIGKLCPIPIVQKKKKPITMQHIHKDTTGKTRYTELHAYPIFDNKGNVIQIIEYSIDITKRKKAKEALYRYAERLQAIHDIDKDILTAKSSKEIAKAALKHIRSLISCPHSSVVEFNYNSNQGQVLATYTEGKIKVKRGALFSLETYGIEFLKKSHINIVQDISKIPHPLEFHKILLANGINSYINIPLISQGKLIGSLNLTAKSYDSFTKNHRTMAKEVATSLAIAIQQIRLFEQTEHDAKTKAMLLDEVNHRTKNNLTAIIGLLYAERNHAGVKNNIAHQNSMNDLINRIQGISITHNLLSAYEWKPLLLSELISRIIDGSLQQLPYNKYLSVTVSPSTSKIIPRQANSLALIINELTTNSIKYALSEQDKGTITVNITVINNNMVELIFKDDGAGYSDTVLQLEQYNVGMGLIQNLVYDLQGELSLHNDNGAVAVLKFQIKEEN